jgi:hypothetical protein
MGCCNGIGLRFLKPFNSSVCCVWSLVGCQPGAAEGSQGPRDQIKTKFRLRDHLENRIEFVARIIHTISTVLDTLAYSTTPDFADLAIPEQKAVLRRASFAVDILWLQVCAMFFRPQHCDLFTLFIVVVHCGQPRATILAIDSTESNHLVHLTILEVISAS